MHAESAAVHQREEILVGLLAKAARREAELESLYVAGEATPDQLEELESVREQMDEYVLTLDGMGYFNAS